MLQLIPLQQLVVYSETCRVRTQIQSPFLSCSKSRGHAQYVVSLYRSSKMGKVVFFSFHYSRHQALIYLFKKDVGLRIAIFLPNLLEKGGIKLWLQLFVPVFIDNVSYFLFSADMRRIVRVTFQPFSSTNVYYCLSH